MGNIINITQRNKEKVRVTLEITYDELKFLEGNIDNIFAIAEETLKYESRIIKRGKRESTKYFLIPRPIRDNIFPSEMIMCNRLKTNSYYLYFFAVPCLINSKKKGEAKEKDKKQKNITEIKKINK